MDIEDNRYKYRN